MAGQIDFIPTGAWEVVRQPQMTEELTYGVTELEDDVWQNIGVVTELGMEVTIEEDIVRILGNRDIYNQLKLGVENAFAIRYKAQGTRFMRYGTELVNRAIPPDNTMVAPNGTNFASLSLLLSTFIDDTEKWRLYKGAKTASIAIGISRDNGIEIEQNFMCKSITEWIDEPTWISNTYAGAISGNPWTGISMGADPLDVAGIKVQCPEINFNVDQGLGQIKPTGIESVYYVGATNRAISLDFITWVKNSLRIQQVYNHTSLALTFLMNAGALITTTGTRFNSYTSTIVTGSSDFLQEEIAGSSKTLTVPQV